MGELKRVASGDPAAAATADARTRLAAKPAKRHRHPVDPRSGSSKVAFELRRRRQLEGLRTALKERLTVALRGHAYHRDGTLLDALEPPRESFNRWLFSGDAASLEGEILDDLPVKLANWYPTELEKKRANLAAWRGVMRRWWTDHMVWDESSELQALVFSEDLDEVSLSANEIRTKMRAIVGPVAGPLVRGVVAELALLRDAARLCFSSAAALASAGSQAEPPKETCGAGLAGDEEAPVPAYEVTVDFDLSRRVYTLTARRRWEAATAEDDAEDQDGESFEVSQWAYDKLSELFLPGLTSCSFWEEALCCLCRYQALCGEAHPSEGAGLQCALPQEVFDLLPVYTVEAFASPFNVSRSPASGSTPSRRFHRYFSVFPEDRVFGSLGNFFDEVRDLVSLRSLLGDGPLFVEANPPFDVFVMDQLVDRIEGVLQEAKNLAIRSAEADQPQLHVLFAFPEWQTNTFRTESPITRLQESQFLLETKVRRPHQHRYVKGRCWTWAKLPEARGPPLQPGVSKSRLALLGLGQIGDRPLLEELCAAW